MGFKDLKRNSQNSMDKLIREAEKLKKGGGESSYEDDRFWKPTLDKSSNGTAVIRFLPAADGDDLPWVRQFSHGFQAKGGWFIENCPTTVGGKCPVCEANNELWNSGVESDKKIVRDRKRKLSYISNIIVISDPANPSNEGKVFLYKYGKKIFEKIEKVMHPQFEDEEAMNPFDFWKGADFKLRVCKRDGYINYDDSKFSTSKPLFGGDDSKLEALWKTEYSLKEFNDPKQYKSYEELSRKMNSVLTGSGNGAKTVEQDSDSDEEFISKHQNSKPHSEQKVQTDEDDSSIDSMSYFEKLARGDE